MHFSILALISMILAVVVTGEAPLKPVIVSFPNKDTPNSVYIQAKDAILEAGGVITHEFKVIKGFSANAAEEALSAIQTLGLPEFHPIVEEDQMVTIYNDNP